MFDHQCCVHTNSIAFTDAPPTPSSSPHARDRRREPHFSHIRQLIPQHHHHHYSRRHAITIIDNMAFEDLAPATQNLLRQKAVTVKPLGLQTIDRVSSC